MRQIPLINMNHLNVLVLILVAISVCSCVSQFDKTITFQGTSMLPAINDGASIHIRKIGPGSTHKIERGSIVVYLFSEDKSKFYIKRVVGLPQEKIEVKEGTVFINGEALQEEYVYPGYNRARTSHPSVFLKSREYYLLGDNRDNSYDSRYSGPVGEADIIAQVVRN